MKQVFLSIILLSMFASPAFSQGSPGPSFGWIEDAKAECFYNDVGEFVLIGEFGEEARSCFAKTYKKGTHVIRVDSPGGQASTGLSLAYRLRGEKFHLIIDNMCNSSCAQYLIPAAHEVSLTKNSGILLHGSIFDLPSKKHMKEDTIRAGLDRGMSKSEAKREYRVLKKRTKLQITATEDHQQNYDIGTGWFMQSGSWTISADQRPVEDDAVLWMKDNKINGLLADRLFFETCLPNVKINEFYGPSHPEHLANAAFQERVKKANVSVLPDAACIEKP